MLPIHFGQNQREPYFAAVTTLRRDFEQGKLGDLTKKINDTFFDGGPFAPKSYDSIMAIREPEASKGFPKDYLCNRNNVPIIGAPITLRPLLGLVEGIPILGSPIAAIHAIGELFYMIKSYVALNTAIKKIHTWEQDPNLREFAISRFANDVLDASIQYTNSQNLLLASLVSIIPLLKPIIRLAQIALNNPAIPSRAARSWALD